MTERICIIGLDEAESSQIKDALNVPVVAHVVLPKIVVRDGELWVEDMHKPRLLPVTKVIYHGIYENDHDFLAALALWGGPCLPNARAMMDCRLKLPCLVRVLAFTQFGQALRGYASPYVRYESETERVAKWGNWHCGENKERFIGTWQGDEPSIIEPYFDGQAVRVVIIGAQAWQIRLEGDSWLKSIHDVAAQFMEVDPELLADTQRIQAGMGLEIIANDYIIGDDGNKHLLEVNHIPNVTRFPELWQAYRDFVIKWVIDEF